MRNKSKAKTFSKKSNRPTLTVRSSILKYLNRPTIANISLGGSKAKGEMSLIDRIKLRESKSNF